jgi:hypothetical protein
MLAEDQMKPDYQDILDVAELVEPTWYDENGVPRFCHATPELVATAYPDQVVFMYVICQHCNRVFPVALAYQELSQDTFDLLRRARTRTLYYGEPPRHACPGDSYATLTTRIHTLWQKDSTNESWYELAQYRGLSVARG